MLTSLLITLVFWNLFLHSMLAAFYKETQVLYRNCSGYKISFLSLLFFMFDHIFVTFSIFSCMHIYSSLHTWQEHLEDEEDMLLNM